MERNAVDQRLGAFNGDLDLLLRAIDAAALDGAVLELDGSADELHAFVEERTRDEPELLNHNIRCRPGPWRGIWLVRWRSGGAGDLRLPVDGDNLRELRRLAENLAELEIADCVTVRHRDGTLLIEALDVGDDEIWVNSRRVTPSSLDAMRKTLGSSLS
jgi:hypothetical protein